MLKNYSSSVNKKINQHTKHIGITNNVPIPNKNVNNIPKNIQHIKLIMLYKNDFRKINIYFIKMSILKLYID